jgi:tRNA modification GTPase
VIEEVLNIHGIPVRLMDTAGLRKATDSVEKEGLKRTREKMEDADLILLVIDGSREIEGDDEEILRQTEKRKKIVVLNKKDLPLKVSLQDLRNLIAGSPIVSISALKNEGTDDLRAAIHDSVVYKKGRTSPDYLIIANVRHRDALTRARENLSNAVRELERKSSPEFVAFEIRLALEALGELVGETTTEDVLNRIFGQFCIGK